MKTFFNQERMLSLVDLKWHMFGDVSGMLFVCNQCLPIVVPEGIDFMQQCGDDRIFGHVFLDNVSLHETGMPRLHSEKCANCGEYGHCWQLDIRLRTLGYVHDHEIRTKHLDNCFELEVVIMGKRGRIVQSMGHDRQRPWITLYTIKFDDGTKFQAYRWQFQVVQS